MSSNISSSPLGRFSIIQLVSFKAIISTLLCEIMDIYKDSTFSFNSIEVYSFTFLLFVLAIYQKF